MAPDVETLAAQLAEIRQKKAILAEAERDLETQLADQVTGPRAVHGGWLLERTGGTPTRKNHDSAGLFRELIGRSNIHRDTGEVLDPERSREQLIQAIRDCLPLGKSTGWKVSGLTAWGLDIDEWCEKSPSRVGFKVTPIDNQEGAGDE